jgi:hypothetical protein
VNRATLEYPVSEANKVLEASAVLAAERASKVSLVLKVTLANPDPLVLRESAVYLEVMVSEDIPDCRVSTASTAKMASLDHQVNVVLL